MWAAQSLALNMRFCGTTACSEIWGRWAINSNGQIVGESFNCDMGIFQTVVWDKGSIIKLDVPIPEPTNINERGEIADVGLPPGCEDSNLCGHEFLLVPCDNHDTQGCEDNTSLSTRIGSTAVITNSRTPAQRREMTKEFVAQLGARLAERYHIPRVGAPKHLTVDGARIP